MASPPKPPPRPAHPPQPAPRPPATPSHASAPPPPKPEPAHEAPKAEPRPAKPEPEVDVATLPLSYTVHTSMARLEAAHAEVKAWTHNLEQALQSDLDAGVLTEEQASAVAEKSKVKAPTPAKADAPEAKETTPEMNEAAAAEGAKAAKA